MSGYAGTVSAYECTKCQKLFVDKPNANRHLTSEKCSGATLVKHECGLVKLSGTPPPCITNTHHGSGNINHGNVHINQLTIVTSGGSTSGGTGQLDVVHAGSEEETLLIRDIILTNEGLRRMIRTIENAALAIFEATKVDNR